MKTLKMLSLLLLVALLTLTSCRTQDLEFIEESGVIDTGSNAEFSYKKSDDHPLEYNLNDGGSTMQYSGGMLYFHNNGNRTSERLGKSRASSEGRTLMRYNVESGNVSSVCSDPLCAHNVPDCVFYAMNRPMYINDGAVSFTRLYSDSRDGEFFYAGDHRLVDLTSGEVQIRETFEVDVYTEVTSQLRVGKYVLYYDMYRNDDLEDAVYAVWRWDTESGEKTVLAGYDEKFDKTGGYYSSVNFLFALDNGLGGHRVYFTDTKSIFSTDIDFNNRIDHAEGVFLYDVMTDGEYIYYAVENTAAESDLRVYNLHRMTLDGKDDTDLGILYYDMKITSEYIYYTIGDSRVIGKEERSGEDLVLYNSEIWRCRHDGSDKKIVYKFDGEMENYRFLGSTCIVGNYIYGKYTGYFDKNGDGIYAEDEIVKSDENDMFDIIRIDITTGEIYIIDGLI